MVVSAFDFDNTITHRDSFFAFLRYTHGAIGAYLRLARLLPYGVGYELGRLSRTDIKQAAVQHFYTDWSLEKFRQTAERFAQEELPSFLKPEAVERLRWHQSQGHRCILVSASFELYLKPWAQSMGFDDVLGTRVEVVDGKLSGRLIGENCWGPEKVRRLDELLGERKAYQLYAYGDSRGDKELLAYADHPFYREMPKAMG